MTVETNADRAALAIEPLELFAARTRFAATDRDMDNPEARDEAAGDLIADLCHLIDDDGTDPLGVLVRAAWHYDEETAEQLAAELTELDADGAEVARLIGRRARALADRRSLPWWRPFARREARLVADSATGQLLDLVWRILLA